MADLKQNELDKHVLPFIPFLPFKNAEKIEEVKSNYTGDLWKADPPTPKEKQFFPLLFKKESEDSYYMLPYEPLIDISGGHTIIKRNVFKQAKNQIGTIKEYWTSNDYEITVRGFLMGSLLTGSVKECFPISDFTKLKDYLTCGESISVLSEPLNLLDILEIVVEDFSIPFTKGENVQAYEFKAYSNLSTSILIEMVKIQEI